RAALSIRRTICMPPQRPGGTWRCTPSSTRLPPPGRKAMHDIVVTVNGRRRRGRVEARRTLADFLREDCALTGTHLGCEQGACGSCTVLMDGDAVQSCLVLAVQADGAEVLT